MEGVGSEAEVCEGFQFRVLKLWSGKFSFKLSNVGCEKTSKILELSYFSRATNGQLFVTTISPKQAILK